MVGPTEPMIRFATAVSLALPLFLAVPASAQRQLQLLRTFADPRAGAGVNGGVTQDGLTGHFFVVDSTGGQTVHEFDANGTFLTQLSANGCTPASPHPHGVTHDSLRDSLWVLDGNETGPGLVLAVTELDRAGVCRGGFTMPPLIRPGGIAFDPWHDTLWIASSGQVDEFSVTGAPAGGSFPFVTTFGSRRLSGITYVPQLDRLLIVAENEAVAYEVERNGRSTTVLDFSPFGITNPQGIHFSPVTSTLTVFDEASSMVSVFALQVCTGSVTRFGQGCTDPTGTPLSIQWSGCPAVGDAFWISLQTGVTNTLPAWIAVGTSVTSLPNGISLPLDLGGLGAPGCFLYTSHEIHGGPLTNPGGGAGLRFTVPNDPALRGVVLHWQGYQAGPGIPSALPIVTSDALTVQIG